MLGFAGKANEVLTAVVLLFPLAGTLSNIDLNGVEGFVVTTSTTTITVGQDSKFLFGMVRFVESTRVHFGSLHTSYPLLLEAYLDGGDWKDKAGGYGIQSDAAGLISRIEGCYYNVVGFPLYSFISKLLELKDKNLI